MSYRVKYRSRILGAGLMLAVLPLVGCATPNTYYCDDGCGPQGISGRFSGGSGCGNCGDCAAVPTVATDCDACGDCGTSSCDCDAAYSGCGLTVTGALRRMVTCNAGCGQIYWGEWTYDPPDRCDPCDDCGDWVGARCCPPSCWARLWEGLHGARFCEATCQPACGSGACDQCDGGPDGMLLEQGPMQSMGEYEVLGTSEPATLPRTHSTLVRAPQRVTRPNPSRNPQSRLVRRPN